MAEYLTWLTIKYKYGVRVDAKLSISVKKYKVSSIVIVTGSCIMSKPGLKYYSRLGLDQNQVCIFFLHTGVFLTYWYWCCSAFSKTWSNLKHTIVIYNIKISHKCSILKKYPFCMVKRNRYFFMVKLSRV